VQQSVVVAALEQATSIMALMTSLQLWEEAAEAMIFAAA